MLPLHMMDDCTRFYCLACGAKFLGMEADYHTVQERHIWLDDCPVETLSFMACPECGCEDIEEIDGEEEDDG